MATPEEHATWTRWMDELFEERPGGRLIERMHPAPGQRDEQLYRDWRAGRFSDPDRPIDAEVLGDVPPGEADRARAAAEVATAELRAIVGGSRRPAPRRNRRK